MKQKNILIILVPTFLITALWVLFSIYHSFTTSTIKSPLDIQIIPISGTFDMNTITQIKNRQNITPEYNAVVQEADISTTPTPTTALEEEIINEDEIIEEDITPTPSTADEEVILEEEIIE